MFVPSETPPPPRDPAETHRAARIRLHQVADRQPVVLVDIEQPGVGRERRRRIVQHAAVHERAGDLRILVRVPLRLSLCVEPLRPHVGQPELARDQVLAGGAIEHEEIPVARRRHHQLARAAVERRVDDRRRLRRIPVVRVVRRRLEVPLHLARESTSTASSDDVNRLSPSPRPCVYEGVGLPVPYMYRLVSGS